MTDHLPIPPIDLDASPAGRILATARELLLRDRYSGLTMGGLAFALGMSKKTLYVHFASKDAIVSAIIEATGATIRRQVGALLAGPEGFPAKLEGLLAIVAAQFGPLTPEFLQDLQRYAPHLYGEIDALKERNIRTLFARLLAIGVEQGMVRADIDPALMVEYWLQIIKGVHDPAVLARTDLTPRAAFEKAVDLFLTGILTPEGRAGRAAGAPAS